MAQPLDYYLGETIIDSRDLIKRLNELADAAVEERDGDGYCAESKCDADKAGPGAEYPELCSDHATELLDLIDIDADGKGFPDWTYGEAMILDGYFTEYAQQLAEDIGAVNEEAGWPLGYIDWPAAAEALRQDYGVMEFKGYEYLIRA